MERLNFDSNGRLARVDGLKVEKDYGEEEEEDDFEVELTHEEIARSSAEIKSEDFWSLFSDGKELKPLVFSNGKSQEDVVKETIDLINSGKKVVLIKGMCGTGKSAIALNVARVLGKASIVVPIKNLQRQYQEDYSEKKYLIKKNGKRMKISVITGRDNHESLFFPGESCANNLLPENIKITEINREKIMEYYKQNPYINYKGNLDVKEVKRLSIAPANPYWSPILPGDIEFRQLKDAEKKLYKGLRGRDFIFYHRKKGCGYYDQYQAYIDSDVIVFNSAKYKIEVALDRKPETEVEIIDEADEFLDNFSNQSSISLTKLTNSLKYVNSDDERVREKLDKILEYLEMENRRISALGINEDNIYPANESLIEKIIKLTYSSKELQADISLDEGSYANKLLDLTFDFYDFLTDSYVTYKKYENEVYLNIVSVNLSKKLKEIVDKSKAMVLMSGTFHSEEVLKEVFGFENYGVVEAEIKSQADIEIVRTGKEFDCKYSNFYSGQVSKDDYLLALSKCMDKAERPTLIHVNAFDDLPSDEDLNSKGLFNLMSKERVSEMQKTDKTGKTISLFKKKMIPVLFSTRCSRGIDFPGDVCNSMIFTKYPNPNIRGIFWKVLQKTNKKIFWDYYRDRAKREFLQRLFRAIRFPGDKVKVLSPDIRVLDAVREFQMSEK